MIRTSFAGVVLIAAVAGGGVAQLAHRLVVVDRLHHQGESALRHLRQVVTRLAGPAAFGRILAPKLFPKPDQRELRERFKATLAANDRRAYVATLPPGTWLFPANGEDGHLSRQVFARDLKGLAGRAGIASARVAPASRRPTMRSMVCGSSRTRSTT